MSVIGLVGYSDPYCYKGPFINDIMQVGVGGMYFCDTLYEDVGKTPVLARQRGEGVNFVSKLHDVIHECPHTLDESLLSFFNSDSS